VFSINFYNAVDRGVEVCVDDKAASYIRQYVVVVIEIVDYADQFPVWIGKILHVQLVPCCARRRGHNEESLILGHVSADVPARSLLPSKDQLVLLLGCAQLVKK